MDAERKFESALRRHSSGDLHRAEFLYREILNVFPGHAPSLHLLGVICYQRGDLHRAAELIRKSLLLFGANPDAYNHLGSVLKAKGSPGEAVECFKKAIELKPDFAEAYYNLGNVLAEKGNLDEAVQNYQKAVSLNPRFFAAYCNMGNALRDLGKRDAAIISYQKALELNPDSEYLYNVLGTVFQETDQPGKAMECFSKAIGLNPGSAEAHASLAKLLQEKKSFDDALTYYRNALRLGSDGAFLANVHNNMGVIHQERGEFDQAIACYQEALRLDPGVSGIHKNLGTFFHDVLRLRDAEDHYVKALDLDPGDAELYCNLGSVLQDEGRFVEASENYRKALHINPGLVEAHWNTSLLLLLQGNFGDGWKKYEWRLLEKDARPNLFPQPLWDGRSLKRKRLVISSEQGVGDEIMFASCLPDIISQADLCIVECDKRLVPLFARSFREAKFIERIGPADPVPKEASNADMRVALGSLPKFLRSDFSSFPRLGAYLEPDSRKVEIWRNRFSELGTGPKVGISWKGGGTPPVRLARSTTLEQWMKLFGVSGAHFISLQYGDCAEELGALKETNGIVVHDWEDADPLKDLDNFAAEISALDLVISVDNSTVHMAGALGIPVLTLLPHASDWRWMRSVEDTPWYGTIRLIRQNRTGGWEEVFERAASALADYVSTGVMPQVTRSWKNCVRTGTTAHPPYVSALTAKKYKCAVVTPVGPGHENFYRECLASVERSFAEDKGHFSEILPIKIDDPAGRLGRSKARNIGVVKAAEHDADWIFFLDADDVMSPRAFEYVSRYLNEFDGVWGSIWSIERGEHGARERPHQLPFLYDLDDVISCDPFETLQMGHFVKTRIAREVPFNDSLDTGEDFDYYLRVWEKYRCIKIPLPFFYNRRGFHSRGPKSTTGRDWRHAVTDIIKKRY